jgi:hypothetical protein
MLSTLGVDTLKGYRSKFLLMAAENLPLEVERMLRTMKEEIL